MKVLSVELGLFWCWLSSPGGRPLPKPWLGQESVDVAGSSSRDLFPLLGIVYPGRRANTHTGLSTCSGTLFAIAALAWQCWGGVGVYSVIMEAG